MAKNVMLCDTWFLQSQPSTYTSKYFQNCLLVFSAAVFPNVSAQHRPALHIFHVSALSARFFVVAFAAVSWSVSCFMFYHFKFM